MVMLNYRVIENPQFSPNNSHGISSIVSAPVIHIVQGGVGVKSANWNVDSFNPDQ